MNNSVLVTVIVSRNFDIDEDITNCERLLRHICRTCYTGYNGGTKLLITTLVKSKLFFTQWNEDSVTRPTT